MASKLYAVTARLLIASFLVLAASPVWAQAEQESATAAPETGRWKALIFVIVFFVAITIGCFMNPKRTHQD